MSFFDAVRAGIAAFKEGDQPSEYSVGGRPVRCPLCTHTKFLPGRALLNSKVRSVFNVDWLDPTASLLVCGECGRIEWFAQEPDRTGP